MSLGTCGTKIDPKDSRFWPSRLHPAFVISTGAMRIIAGEYRRRNLFSPPGDTTRPIPDRVKESLFSMLGKRLEGAAVLDCFAGSGAIGLEALSRGASSCIFVEKDRHSADVLEKNIAMLKCEDRATVVRGDALGLSVIARCPQPLDLAFFDPPSNPGSTVLVHKQPENVWRIDYQLRAGEDPDEAVRPENVIPRVESLLAQLGEAVALLRAGLGFREAVEAG